MAGDFIQSPQGGLLDMPVPSVPYTPSWTDQASGWLNGVPNDPNSSSAYPTVNRLGLIGGGLADAGAALQGREGGTLSRLMQQNRDASMGNRMMQARQALSAALNGNDDTAKKTAVMNYIAAGGDPKDFLAASRPTTQDIGGVPVQTDPITGKVTPVSGFTAKPEVSGGLQFDRASGQWKPIPGYVDQQSQIYGARYAAHAANPMPARGGKKPAVNFTPGTGSPASAF